MMKVYFVRLGSINTFLRHNCN